MRLIKAKSKMLGRKRLMQFAIFAAVVVPFIIGFTYLFKFVELKTVYQVLIDSSFILAFFASYFFLILKPLEKYQMKLRQQKREAQKQDGEK